MDQFDGTYSENNDSSYENAYYVDEGEAEAYAAQQGILRREMGGVQGRRRGRCAISNFYNVGGGQGWQSPQQTLRGREANSDALQTLRRLARLLRSAKTHIIPIRHEPGIYN